MNWDAVALALAQHAAPARAEELRARALPTGITELLRVALGQKDTLDAAAVATRAEPQQLIDAARFFIEQQLLARVFDADAWRLLGLTPGADEETIKTHHRLLVRLVHPDRSDDWAEAYADRVNRAWRQLRHAQDRSAIASGVARSDERGLWEGHPGAASPPFRVAMAAPAGQGESPPQRGTSWLIWGAAALTIVVAMVAVARLGSPQAVPDDVAPKATPESTTEPPWYDQPETMAGDPAPAALDELVPIDTLAGPGSEPPPAPTVPTSTQQVAPYTGVVATTARSTRPPAAMPAPKPRRPPAVVAPIVAATPQTDPPPEPAVEQVVAVPVATDISPTTRPTIAIADASSANLQTPSLDPDNGQAVLRDFRARYAEGDLGGLLKLYSSQVHAEHHRLGQLANDYARLFKESQQRYIDFSNVRWQQQGDRLLGQGRYETGYRKLKTLRKHLEIGRVELELVREGDESRLRRFDLREGGRS